MINVHTFGSSKIASDLAYMLNRNGSPSFTKKVGSRVENWFFQLNELQKSISKGMDLKAARFQIDLMYGEVQRLNFLEPKYTQHKPTTLELNLQLKALLRIRVLRLKRAIVTLSRIRAMQAKLEAQQVFCKPEFYLGKTLVAVVVFGGIVFIDHTIDSILIDQDDADAKKLNENLIRKRLIK